MIAAPIDPDNPVVKLCVAGMRAEGEGRRADAQALFRQAWAVCTDDYDACIAAHYLARLQDTDEETLHWNEEALRRADAVADERVHDFYPSLFLNVAHAHEVLGDRAAARRYYERTLDSLNRAGENAYGEHMRDSIVQALARVGERLNHDTH